MRFIIREQEYERLLAAGHLSYRSGVSESWRLTEAVAGYHVMRVDLDKRDTGVDDSTLLHLLLDPDGRLERAKLRALSADGPLAVDVLVAGNSLSVSRVLEDDVLHDEFDMPAGFGLLLPGVIGLALFVSHAGHEHHRTAVALDAERRFAPSSLTVKMRPLGEESIAMMGQHLAVRRYLIQMGHKQCTLWLDRYNLPVRADDEDGTLAVEDRYVRHRQV